MTTCQDPLQLHGQTITLPHQDARHGTIEHGGCLRWSPSLGVLQLQRRRGEASASSFLVVASVDLGDDPLESSPSRSTLFLVFDLPRLLWSSFANGSLFRTIRVLRIYHRRKVVANRGEEGVGRPAWPILSPVRLRLLPRVVSCTLGFFLLRIWALDVVISATKLRGVYA